MRIGIFGGSFDPVHNAHLALAEACHQGASLDRVLFVPAAQQPHKPAGPVAEAKHRLAMLQLAIVGQSHLEVSDVEISRGGVSFTVDTLREIASRNPDSKLYLLMGADTLQDLPTWRDPQTICKLATPLAVHRPGEPLIDFTVLSPIASDEVLKDAQQHVIDMPLLDISSSKVREHVGLGKSISESVPASVAAYIVERGLYRGEASSQ